MNKIYGKYFFNQLSLDLGKMFEDVKCFFVSNLKYIARWYAYYNRGQKVVDQKYIDSDFVNIPLCYHIATTVNSTLTMMYWHIGHRINQGVLDNQRAEYGKQIVATLSTQLAWSHILEILPSKEVLHKQIQKSLEAAKALRDNSIEEA